MRVGGQHHAQAALIPDKETSTYLKGGWVDTRAGLDKKVSPPPGPDPTARSKSLYRLRFSGQQDSLGRP